VDEFGIFCRNCTRALKQHVAEFRDDPARFARLVLALVDDLAPVLGRQAAQYFVSVHPKDPDTWPVRLDDWGEHIEVTWPDGKSNTIREFAEIEECLTAWARSPRTKAPQGDGGEPPAEPKQGDQSGQSEKDGRSREPMFIAALIKHHNYPEITVTPFARVEDTGLPKQTASRYFQKHFGSWQAYRDLCVHSRRAELFKKLCQLAGETQQHSELPQDM
jgi:hypothetical protein